MEKLLPQHTALPSVFRPQVWPAPAVIAVNEPSGGLLWPLSSLPQHRALPSVFRPQVWE